MERLTISENRRYFVKETGEPFVWIADTVWTMPQRMKWDDIEYLMKKRKSQGFTVLQIVALDPEQDVEMRNPAGIAALEDGDLTKPREQYFAYLDWILDRAEDCGFYVLLLPVWGQLVVGDNWMGGTFPKTVTEENAYGYGQWIGARYKNRENVVWCLGGDRQPIHKGVDYRNVWRRLAEGLSRGILGRELAYDQEPEIWRKLLITYHACHEMETGECSSMSYWTDQEQWIQFIMLQSGHGSTPKNYQLVEKEYRREEKGQGRTMPVWDGEPAYEKMPTSFPVFTEFHGSWMVRKRAYWALLAGAFGHTYGHCSVWCSISEKERNEMMRDTWWEALDAEGAGQIRYLRDFMEAVPLWDCVPAQELICQEEDGEMDAHIQAAIQTNGEFLCAYLPSGGSCRIRIGSMREKAADGKTLYGFWFNPRDGKCYDAQMQETDRPFLCKAEAGAFCKTDQTEAGVSRLEVEEHMFCSPEQGTEKDWVLLLYGKEVSGPIASGVYGEALETGEIKKVFEW